MPIAPPAAPPVQHHLPDEPLLLMGAGPTPIPEAVRAANGVVLSHLGEPMNTIIEGLKDLARYAFQTRAEHVIGIAGSSSAAMEMAMGNLLWPGRRVLCLVCGSFSARLAQMAEGVGADVTVLQSEPNRPVELAAVQRALSTGRYDVVTAVQGETSCGVRTVDLPGICALAQSHGALMMVDTVCTLSTMAFQADDWGVDAMITGGQKGLACIPGISLAAFSDAAWAAVERRPRPMPHWCLDAQRAWNFWGAHTYHYTAPVPGLLALYEALRLIAEETLEARIARHTRCTQALQAGIEALGLRLFVPEAVRLPSVLAIEVPARVDPAVARHHAATAHHVEIAGAFGLPIVRIGQMGEQCRDQNVLRAVNALGSGMAVAGARIDLAAGMAAAAARLGRAGVQAG